MKQLLPYLLGLGLGLQSAAAADAVVVFNEVHYHPSTNEAASEWVELRNQMAIDIDLSAWTVRGGIDFLFPEGTIIPAGGYLVVASDPAVLRETSGATNVVGPFTGRLNNSGDRLELRDRNRRLMDRLEYTDGGKWPVAPDGSGVTLAKRLPDAPSDAPELWTSSVLVGGTPGGRNFPADARPQRRQLIAFDAAWRFEASGTDLGASWRDPGFDDSAWQGGNNATLIAYWRFDGDAIATRGANGALVGTVLSTTDRNGVPGGALAFNGSSQYVSVAGGGGLSGASAGTISLWVKWSGTQDADCCGSYGAVLARQGNGLFSDNILALSSPTPSSARVVWRQSGGPAPVLITGTTVVGTTWHHLAVTFAPGGSTLYVDGVPQGTAVGSSLNNNSSVPLSIGAWAGDGAGFASASIDDVAIWDQPLSAEQVAQLFAQTRAPLDFPGPEKAVYYAGNGRLTTNDELRHTTLPLGPTTYYFRNSFQSAYTSVDVRLALDLAINDGAVFYLNGAEVYRHNMPPGPVVYATLAAGVVGDAPFVHDLSLSATNLLIGTNVLAVEVHQASLSDPGMVFGAGLSAILAPAPATEERTLIALADSWKLEGSDTDLGMAWRAPGYNDAAWSNGPAVFFAGSGSLEGTPPALVAVASVTASSQFTSDGRLAIHAANGAGLVGNAHVNTPAGTMWLNNGTFASPNDLSPFIAFDLGTVVPLRLMKVWNYNEGVVGRPELLARGVARADVLVAGASGGFTTHMVGQTFNIAPGTQTDFSQAINLGGVQARFVKLDKLTNFPGGDSRFVGLSEVQFFRDVDLRRTEVPLGPTTCYFRKTFHFAGDPAGAELLLDAAVDDGAVFYLNGVEVRRVNLPEGLVTHATLASGPVGSASFTGPIALSTASLLSGPNVLAVEVHQAASGGDTDMAFGATLTARVQPPPSSAFNPGALVFNEISAAGATAFQIEMINRGSTALDVGGYVIGRMGAALDAEYTIPSQTLQPGGLLVVSHAELGFGAAAGDKLFLFLPGKRGVADALEVHERARALWPDASGEWLTPAAFTPGASNDVARQSAVVFNEIMYHAPPSIETPAVIVEVTNIPYTNVWRFEQSGLDLGTAWRAPDYDDSSWPEGRGLLFVSTSTLPAPKNTPLTLGARTYYFRTALVYTGSPAIQSLTLRHIVDDGAVIYFNGKEISRFNLPAAPAVIAYTNTATVGIGTAIVRGPVTIALTNLVVGTNVIAVEVHQAAVAGNDVVFGAELSSTIEASPRIPFSESPEQWVELFNRSSNAVNLTGWRLDEGIDFRFSSNTVIQPGGYLVVAKDPAALLAAFPGVPVVGPFTNRLSHRGERLVIKDAADNPADVVRYFDGGRWPGTADGGGSSLELRDPWADNAAGEAWAASDESRRSGWRNYSYRGVLAASAVGPDTQWNEFVMGMLGEGVVLLDDIAVIETPATTPTNLIQNGTFDSGTNKWRILGNHHGEIIDDPDQPGNKVLKLTATGATEHMSNHGETTFAGNRAPVNGREYLIAFRARWISGSPQFHTRIYFNRLARTTVLDTPTLHGTPGARNTAFATNLGPTFDSLRHDPPVPAPFAPVTVSVEAADPDGVAAMALWWRPDGGSWQSSPMAADPSSPNRYVGTLPGKAAGTVLQFCVEGLDALGARSCFPADGTNSRALVQFDDGLAATNGLHNVRLVTLTEDADILFRTVNLMSNERILGTVIYDEGEIFYDCGLRLKGSEHSRTTTPRLGFNVSFSSEQMLRGIHRTVAIDRSESTGFGQREMLIHQTLNHAGGVPTKYHDLIQVIAPRSEYTGSAELQLARYTDVFLEDQYRDGEDGTVFEYELIYQLNSTDDGTPEGNKVPAPDSVVGTALRNLGADKEAYRWNLLIKNNEDRDDYSRIMALCQTMELSGAAFNSAITNVIEVDSWLRGVAVNVLAGCGDSYGGDGAQHNVQFYARPDNGLVVYFPHDMDAFFDASRSIVPNSDLSKLIAVPAYARAYYGHLLDIMATTYNVTYLARWANQFGRLLPAQPFSSHLAFVQQRGDVVTSAVNAAVPNVAFAIGNNSGNDFATSNSTVSLTGTAPLRVKAIQVNGVSHPITWTSLTNWTVSVRLPGFANLLVVQGVDNHGLALTNAIDSITVTNRGVLPSLPVVINEWMADNMGPGGLPDPADGLFQDWFELFNPNPNAVDLSGCYLTDDLAQPTRWLIPTNVFISGGGFLLVWADNNTNQNPLGGGTNLDLHACFQLSGGGEAIGLFDRDGVTPLSTVAFGPQFQNVSQGRYPDGDTNTLHFMTNWTPRASNQLVAPTSPELRALSMLPGGVFYLEFRTLPNRAYRVDYKEDLEMPSWTPLITNRTAAAGAIVIHDSMGGQPQRFYRAVLLE